MIHKLLPFLLCLLPLAAQAETEKPLPVRGALAGGPSPATIALSTSNTAQAYFPTLFASVSRTNTGAWQATLGLDVVIVDVRIDVGGGKSATLIVSTSGTTTGSPIGTVAWPHGQALLTIVQSGRYEVRGLSTWTKIRIDATNGATVTVGATYRQSLAPHGIQIAGMDAGAPGSGPTTPIYSTPSGVKSITNTCYVQSFTTSITGVGWVDCRGATSVIATLLVRGRADYAALLGAGVTLYADASGGLATDLPNTNSVPQWNLQALPNPQTGTGVIVDTQFVYPDPPSSLRWRLHGIFNATATIQYTINYPLSGTNITESGPTPPMH